MFVCPPCRSRCSIKRKMKTLGPEELGDWPKVIQPVKAELRTRVLVSWLAQGDAGYSEAMLVVIALYGNGFPSTREAWPIPSYPLILSSVV